MPYSRTNSSFYHLNIENPCTARKPLTETQYMAYTIWTTDCLNEISVSSLHFVSSSLFYFISFQKWFIIFPFCTFDWFTCCFNNAKSREKKERSHVNIYIQKQHICNVVCYTVELHCLYKNRSPDDPRLILMSPCFFLKLFMWLIRLIDLQFKLTFP